MAVWGWAHKLYVETGLIQGTVQPSSYYQLVKSSIQSEYIHKYIHDLMANKPKVFVDAVGSQSIIFNDTTLFRHNNFPMIAKYIAINYNFVGEVNDVRVYIRKN
jgi:hypothetical protein